MWYLKGFITSAECADLLTGIVASINKEAISSAIYNVMDAKVSVKFSFLLHRHSLILSISIFVVQT